MKQVSFKDIYIPNPCSASWFEMKPHTKCSKFCDSCVKEVVDFSKMDELEMNKTLELYDYDVCGRFGEHQVNQDYALKYHQQIHIKLWNWSKKLLASIIATFGFHMTANAQIETLNEPFEIVNRNETRLEVKKTKVKKSDTYKYLRGKLIDQNGNNVWSRLLVKVFYNDSLITSVYSNQGDIEIKLPQKLQGTIHLVIDSIQDKNRRGGVYTRSDFESSSATIDIDPLSNFKIAIHRETKRRKMLTYPLYRHWIGCPKFR